MTHPASKHGMNWIRKDKRLAIYMRDGMQCPLCGRGVEDGIVLTLDHITPWSQGGGNEATNLVTCCRRCNSRRQDRGMVAFVGEHCADPVAVLDFIEFTRHQPITELRKVARVILSNRRTFAGAIAQANAAQVTA